MTTRKIKRVSTSIPTMEGAGVHLHRAFGNSDVPLFDPFLLFDDFRSATPKHYTKGFPCHPHRGIETITYMLKGYAEHGDSLGNKGEIGSGDVQWMTAGSGLLGTRRVPPHKISVIVGILALATTTSIIANRRDARHA